MALINQNSIIGVTSITSPSASNVLTVHTNDTTERLRVSTTGLSFSGTSASLDTSGNLTVSGNVSIGGTLTYEDVTNIDAVGIITARSGLQVTGGSVGIGTDDSQQKLDVRGNAVIGIDQVSGNPGTSIGITTIRGHHVNSDSDYAQLYLSNSKSAGGGPTPTASIRAGRETNNYGTNLSFWTNGTGSAGDGSERLRITSDGKIGINETSPDSLLHLKNNAAAGIRAGLKLESSGTNNSANDTMGEILFAHNDSNDAGVSASIVCKAEDVAGNTYLQVNNGNPSASSERLRISSTGQIGMGKAGAVTPNGNSPLTIQESDSNSETICLRATNSGGNGSQPGIVMKTAAGGHIGGIYCDVNSDYMRLSTSGTDRVIITNTGEMGIGAFTPTAGDGILQIAGGLRVAGSASASDTTSPYIYRTSGYDHLNIATSGVERLRIDSVGSAQFTGQNSPSGRNTRISRYGSLLVATTGELLSNARCSIDSGNGNIATEGEINVGGYNGGSTTTDGVLLGAVGGVYSQLAASAAATGVLWQGMHGSTFTSRIQASGAATFSGSVAAASVNLQSSSTSSWFQTGTSIASYPYVWAAKNSSSNTWHSGLQTDGDLYLGGNLAGTNNIALNGSNGSGWFTGGLGIGGNAAANTMDEYEEGTWTPVMNKSGVSGTVSSPSAAIGYYRRVGQLLWISFYWYKGSGSFGNNAGEWYVSGVPFLLAHGSGSAYQFIPGGYNNINGTNYANQSNRWQSNNTNGSQTLAMYGPNATTNWSSGYAEFSATGCLMLP